MASSQEFRDYILGGCPGLTARAMMGEYLLYYLGKHVGGVYDNRLLVKPIDAACAVLPGAPREVPYEGAKEMLLVERRTTGICSGGFSTRCMRHCRNRHWGTGRREKHT